MEKVTGTIGFILSVVPPFINDIPVFIQIAAGLLGLVFLVFSILYKWVQIKNAELEREILIKKHQKNGAN